MESDDADEVYVNKIITGTFAAIFANQKERHLAVADFRAHP